MRLRDLFAFLIESSAAAPAALLAGLLCAGGCETKSFFDPSEMMRTNKEPLLLPVLNQLDPRDETEPEFTSARDVRQADLEVAAGDYVIGPNDLVNISTTEVAGPSIESMKTARVSESGNVSLPLIGQIKASGRTEAELEKAIADEYRARNLIQNAQVSVTVLEARQRTFSILGMVGRPGQYQIVQSDFRLLDALTLAGDVQVQGLPYLYIIRKNKPPTGAAQPDTKPAETRPAEPPPAQPKPGVDPLEGRRGMIRPSARTAVAAGNTRPLHLALLQDQPADSAGERKVLIDGQWRTIKPGESAPAGATPAPAAAEPAPAQPAPADPLDPGTASPTPARTGETGADAAGPGAAPGSAAFEFEGPKVDPDIEIIRVPLDRLQRGELQYNIVVRANDTMIIPSPKVGEYYIGGHVNRPGVYSLTGRDITLKQAIISAGMVDALGWPERTEVIRRIGKDRELFLRVNLPKIFAAQQPDFYLRPYDTVQVGTNAIAPFLAAMRGAFRMTYGFGFIYDKNFAYDDDQRQF